MKIKFFAVNNFVLYLSVGFLFLSLFVYYIYPERKLEKNQKVDEIVINKESHELLIYSKRRLLATYQISLSKNGLSKKNEEGDHLTPEGVFKGKKISGTKFHKAIAIGKWGSCCGVLIHGLTKDYRAIGKFHRWIDWTEGCIALTNDEMDELFDAVSDGIRIEINP